MKNFGIYGSDYSAYMTMLSSGNCFKIFISKRLLFRPILPMWILLFCIFLIPNPVFFAMAGLPVLVIFSAFLATLFPFWNACGISRKAYIVFHIITVFLLKILAIQVAI